MIGAKIQVIGGSNPSSLIFPIIAIYEKFPLIEKTLEYTNPLQYIKERLTNIFNHKRRITLVKMQVLKASLFESTNLKHFPNNHRDTLSSAHQ